MSQININSLISEELAGLRLDQALVKLFPQYSRSQLQSWITEGKVTVDQQVITKNKQIVYPGQTVVVITELKDQDDWQAEAIPLNIVYEDDHVLLINKPPGLVVHPGAGNPSATLVNALLHHDPVLKKLPRAGLIHRLDKDTSGLLLVAKTIEAQNNLSQQMQDRKIGRIYHAIVKGICPASGTIDEPMDRHPTQRTKMAVVRMGGKTAITHFTLLETFQAHSYLEIKLETGRTHQIRVHMAYIHHPVLGDPLYSKQVKNMHLSADLAELVTSFKRQALHAKKIEFNHPFSFKRLNFEVPLPQDFQLLLSALRNDVQKT